MAKIIKSETESFDDFFVRLFENKEKYGLSCQEIADILNSYVGEDYGESKWRKEYAAFSRGMKYVRNKMTQNVYDRILCISDMHVPFNLPIETFQEYIGIVDTLVINGDVSDCQAISDFPKSYRVSPMRELLSTRVYLTNLIKYLEPKRVFINYGNHDTRFQTYLSKNLDTDILELMPKTSIELIVCDGFNHYDKETGTKTYYCPITELFPDIEIVYTGSWNCQIGKTIFCHPLVYSSGILKTTEKATQFFRNEGYMFDTIVMAHTHHIGEYKMGNTVLYEQGCCCDVKKQHYSDGKLTPSQKEGFVFLCQDKDGNLLKEHTKLIEIN